MTHHHRDSAQGLPVPPRLGIRIHVPPSERDLFAARRRALAGRGRSTTTTTSARTGSRCSSSVPVDGRRAASTDWAHYGVGDAARPADARAHARLGHLLRRHRRPAARVHRRPHLRRPGKVWSLASTQWSYTGHRGRPGDDDLYPQLLDHAPGPAAAGPRRADGRPVRAVRAAQRAPPAPDRRADPRAGDRRQLRELPFVELSPHLLRNRTSQASSYVLLSETGGALLFDYGYDFTTGLPTGSDRSRPPAVAGDAVRALKQRYGVDRVEVAIPTHYHDDHVAGFNLLREVEGTEVWSPANMTRIFRRAAPLRPAVPVVRPDRRRPGAAVRGAVPLARVRAAASTSCPATRCTPPRSRSRWTACKVLATGDQQEGRWIAGEPPEVLNYQYRNRFRIDDFVRSAQLYRDLAPDLVISGHWAPRPVTDRVAGRDGARRPRARAASTASCCRSRRSTSVRRASGPGSSRTRARSRRARRSTSRSRCAIRSPARETAYVDARRARGLGAVSGDRAGGPRGPRDAPAARSGSSLPALPGGAPGSPPT